MKIHQKIQIETTMDKDVAPAQVVLVALARGAPEETTQTEETIEVALTEVMETTVMKTLKTRGTTNNPESKSQTKSKTVTALPL